MLQARREGEKRLSDLERAEFGWTHAEAAGYMARQWSLPEEFAKLIEAHTQIDHFVETNCKEAGKLAVALSALLPAAQDDQWYEQSKFLKYYSHLVGGRKAVEELFAQIDGEFADFAPILKLSSPAKSLAQHLSETTAVKA
jgi:hypothetical protein